MRSEPGGLVFKDVSNDCPDLILVSLYYRNDIFSGANKRFEALAKRMAEVWPGRVYGVVPTGHRFKLVDECATASYRSIDFIEIPTGAYGGVARRVVQWAGLSYVLAGRRPSIVVSDFMPVPYTGLRKHRHYQLIHDVRSATSFGRWRLGGVAHWWQAHQWRRCERLLVVSKCTRHMAATECGIDSDRIVVCYNGVSREFFVAAQETQPRLDFLYVATFEPRKNHIRLIQAFAKLRRRIDRRLTMCLVGRDLGSRSAVESAIREASLEADVEIRESVGNEDALRHLYDSTRVFVSPSLFEGFGMPLVEARARECKVCCSQISIFEEIMGDQATFFDPTSVDSMAAAMEAALNNSDGGRRGREWVQANYTWDTIAKQLAECLLNECT